jgi:beta-aspartyl-peptidase (threonine type)
MPGASRTLILGEFGVLVHGGAGGRQPSPRISGCEAAAREAAAILRAGGTALDAVERAVIVLEDDPAYNAGTGGVLTETSGIEHDAALMDGATLRAGAVSALVGFRNPVAVARAVLEDGRHVFYTSEGAARFAESRGLVRVDPATLITDQARAALARWLAARGSAPAGGAEGTVGAVARDSQGNVAAATSTGGTVGKRTGRVGDSPVLGAGTYADNALGAVSATGHGEGILRVMLAGRLLMDGAASEPERAAVGALAILESRVGSTGGVLVATAQGAFAWARTTEAMPWAASGASGAFSGE